MIPDSQTNFLYLADTLPSKYPDFYKRFESLLNECKIAFNFLLKTKDVWAVDYMPVQVGINTFIQFVYQPSYLTKYKKYVNTISDVDAICNAIGIETIKTDILLDGGNVVKAGNKVIMTDRIFTENPNYERKKLISRLHELLEVDHLFIVPEQPDDYTGHADGMVRFVNDDTVLINDFSRENKNFARDFEMAIQKTGLGYIKIPYCVYNNKSYDQANGDYINYLQMENTVFIPTFNMKEDDEVVKQFETIFAGQTVKTIDSNQVANDGGVLNCISWNIRIN